LFYYLGVVLCCVVVVNVSWGFFRITLGCFVLLVVGLFCVFDLRCFVVLYYSYALRFGLRLGILCLGVICFGCSFQFVVLFCVFYVVCVLVY